MYTITYDELVSFTKQIFSFIFLNTPSNPKKEV